MNNDPPQGDNRAPYLALVSGFPPASIRSGEHLAEAQGVIDRPLGRGELDVGEEIYLDAISDLVACYEDAHHPIEPASDAGMLRHLLEARSVTQAEVSRETGLPESTISEVLSGKRPWSRRMIRKPAASFRVDVSVLAANL